jgi:hypothetical protein
MHALNCTLFSSFPLCPAQNTSHHLAQGIQAATRLLEATLVIQSTVIMSQCCVQITLILLPKWPKFQQKRIDV